MASLGGPNIITNGLVLQLDAANAKSYPGSGTTWRDLSQNGNTGTLTTTGSVLPQYSTANGGSLLFDGASNYVTLGNSKFQYQDTFTVESFFNFPSIPNNPGSACDARYPVIYNHDYGYNLMMTNSGSILWQIYNTVSTNATVATSGSQVGQWTHAVGYKSGTTMGFYVNGNLVGTNTLTTNAVYYVNYPFVIGGFGLCGPNRFYATGNIASVKVYNRVLSPSEIAQNYNATKARFNL
jgi:hypothetical protein